MPLKWDITGLKSHNIGCTRKLYYIMCMSRAEGADGAGSTPPEAQSNGKRCAFYHTCTHIWAHPHGITHGRLHGGYLTIRSRRTDARIQALPRAWYFNSMWLITRNVIIHFVLYRCSWNLIKRRRMRHRELMNTNTGSFTRPGEIVHVRSSPTRTS